ncbi:MULTISPECIES: hypothetical protein [unclassified Mycobacteroides]|uniref:hypothetical protein n=1 Tax=unclassified Mycobacteroides TaxID=2618759 RepID=UPI0007134154|nr:MULTISPECIES: hypothetical protein [unclassified Mycobacteroides]KRQ23308.1 hypothetical protein AOT91_23115 [Mycobacteroides sp. H092]KRQ23477.1 hypothetical protein AOT87_12375 [Mycobacteroides sp. H003]KRQ40286.1 hypothetical protein AOT92_15005 [Mycobacteroides sp. H101]KRQ47401.1 hypothetical protein AOT88_15915 [Mycobacteroides sp. H063]KRQ57734.1 hypothetical protein AOT90_25765 [Mycobacteroides sp. H079]
MFDDLTPDELSSAHATITTTGIHAARLIAADRLASGPAEGLGTPETLVELLQQRDTTDPRWERLQPFEQRWSLLVVRLLDAVSKDPSQAVADARNRGATWAAIADTLGVKTPSAYQRFRHQV